jgi:glucose/mannose-6-phosphate isomerase
VGFDESLLEHAAQLEHRDTSRLLWSLAGSGAQVRRAIALRDEFAIARLGGDLPRALLVAADAPAALAQRLVIRLSSDATQAVAWHGVDLPPWAGAADALLVGAVDGRHPRLAELTAQAVRRGLAVAVVTQPGSPVESAAGRAPVHRLASELHPHASLWAVVTPLLQALEALGIPAAPEDRLERIADALDETSEACRPTGDAFTNPAKALAAEFAITRPVIVGAGPLASVAARACAESVQLAAGVGAVSVSLPDGVGRAGALLRGAETTADAERDFFRDRVDDPGARRARLLVIGDDGDPRAGGLTETQVQLDEVAARRAAAGLRGLAESLGVRASGVDVPDGPPLVRFAAATLFGEFTASYLAFGLGLDPGAPRPAELGH